jgi:hypothetical protein
MTAPKVLGDKEKFLWADWLGRTIAGKKCKVKTCVIVDVQ